MTSRSNQLKVNDLSCERQDQILFNRLNFQASSGQLIRVAGKNGSGKSSLLKIITGLLTPLTGTVYWNNENITLQRTAYARNLTYIGHKPAVKSELTVSENIKALLGLSGQRLDEQQIGQTLKQLALSKYHSVQAGYLSQGQQRRIALSRLWLENTGLWILDEPYTALDSQAVGLIDSVINQALADGVIVVFTSHQLTDDLKADTTTISLGH